MLALGNRTAYEIKQVVDVSTRHFWAASYGQIYPELKRLEDRGLVRGRPEPWGARPRTAYELTEAGEAALQDWLASDEELVDEVRDEGMLKLFFSDSCPSGGSKTSEQCAPSTSASSRSCAGSRRKRIRCIRVHA